jgi:hypothetical protein
VARLFRTVLLLAVLFFDLDDGDGRDDFAMGASQSADVS